MGRLIHLKEPRRPAPTLPSTDTNAAAVDPGFLGVWLVLWLGSVLRTVLGLVHHEVFRTEGTLAFLCSLFVPLLALNHWWTTRAEAGRRRPRDERHF